MKRYIWVILLLCSVTGLGTRADTSAEPSGSPSVLDVPNMAVPKFQFHFTRELIALTDPPAPFDTVDHFYVRIYGDMTAYDTAVQYYTAELKALGSWEQLHRDDSVHLYYSVSQTAPRATGILGIVKSDASVSLFYVVGGIPLAQLPQLLENFDALGIVVPELQALPTLEIDQRYLASPSGFRTREGFPIHEIVIEGNERIETSEIMEALAAGGTDIHESMETFGDRMDPQILDQVDLLVKEEEDGTHVASITIKEHPPPAGGTLGGGGTLRFNRVSGWQLAFSPEIDFARVRFPNELQALRLFGHLGYAFGNRRADYEIGIDSLPFATYTLLKTPEATPDKWYHGFGIKAKLHNLTTPTPDTLLWSDTRFYHTVPAEDPSSYYEPDATLYNIIGGEDLHNYYARSGGEIAVRWEQLDPGGYLPPKHAARLAFVSENHESLEKTTDWHLFNWRSTSKARENPAITEARIGSVLFRYDFSTRRETLGWHHTLLLERSHAGLGSDIDFTRYQVHLRYARALGEHRIRTRATVGFSDVALPIQRQFVIGGPGSLNGYPLHAFAGDGGYLFNIEYFHNFSGPFKRFGSDFQVFFVVFFDAGQTLHVDDVSREFTPKTDAGVGIQFGEPDTFLRINIAKAFESEQAARANLVWFYSF